MKRRFQLLIIVSAMLMFMGGCGKSLYKLTDEEEELIVRYSAYAVAKYNLFQKDGMKMVTNTGTDIPAQDDPQDSSQIQESQQTDLQTEDTTQGGQQSTQAEVPSITLAKAIDHENDLKVFYKGYKVCDSYSIGKCYAINAEVGQKLVIMNFKIKNPGKKDVKLDTLSLNNSFIACFDGKSRTSELESFGIDSLSDYSGKIPAGKSKKTVLIFQIPEKAADKINTEQLWVKIGEKNYPVELS